MKRKEETEQNRAQKNSKQQTKTTNKIAFYFIGRSPINRTILYLTIYIYLYLLDFFSCFVSFVRSQNKYKNRREFNKWREIRNMVEEIASSRRRPMSQSSPNYIKCKSLRRIVHKFNYIIGCVGQLICLQEAAELSICVFFSFLVFDCSANSIDQIEL